MFWRRRSGGRIALVAALLLAIQSALASVALGASAAAAPLDAWGNPICAASAEASPHDPGLPGHSKPPPCCMQGCPMASGVAVGAPPRSTLLLIPGRLALDEAWASFRLVQPPERRWRQGSPRAPPFDV